MKALIFIPLILLAFYSCKKDDDKKVSTPGTAIRYTITPIDSSIIDVRFNNASGTLVVQDGTGDFSDGSKDITITSKPFAARVGLRFEDMVFSTEEYELSIYVNGSLKARDTVTNSEPGNTGEEYLEYTVE